MKNNKISWQKHTELITKSSRCSVRLLLTLTKYFCKEHCKDVNLFDIGLLSDNDLKLCNQVCSPQKEESKTVLFWQIKSTAADSLAELTQTYTRSADSLCSHHMTIKKMQNGEKWYFGTDNTTSQHTAERAVSRLSSLAEATSISSGIRTAPGGHSHAPSCHHFCSAGSTEELSTPPLSSLSLSSALHEIRLWMWGRISTLGSYGLKFKLWGGRFFAACGAPGSIRYLSLQEQLHLSCSALRNKMTPHRPPSTSLTPVSAFWMKMGILHVDCTELRIQDNFMSSFLWYDSEHYSWISKAPPFSVPFQQSRVSRIN